VLNSQTVQLGNQMLTSDAALDHFARTFTGVLIDDRHNLDRPIIGGDIELEVHRPHLVGRIGDDRRCHGRGAVAFPASPLRRPQAFIAPKSLDLLVVDGSALSTGMVVGRTKSTAEINASEPRLPDGNCLGTRYLRSERDGTLAIVTLDRTHAQRHDSGDVLRYSLCILADGCR